jgi:hypothetical protein
VSRADEDDRAAVDRAFAELVAGYHLTADRPDPQPAASADPSSGGTTPPYPPGQAGDPQAADEGWADQHPLFHFPPPTGEPVVATEREPAYVPEPLPPMPRPSLPVLLGWLGIGFAVVLVLAATFGLRSPTWAAWLAVGSFLTGFGILLTQLPRHRPPDAGDGAVL